ncbi:hypothetical protein PALB_16560 [Pseudoalteromonas luteoviolacea B = ATCC 29581]|nr:hypothetical protein PALB_16560 [Pseudoalteromonas luteoviolacea B = ATCC 29581]
MKSLLNPLLLVGSLAMACHAHATSVEQQYDINAFTVSGNTLTLEVDVSEQPYFPVLNLQLETSGNGVLVSGTESVCSHSKDDVCIGEQFEAVFSELSYDALVVVKCDDKQLTKRFINQTELTNAVLTDTSANADFDEALYLAKDLTCNTLTVELTALNQSVVRAVDAVIGFSTSTSK